MTIHQITPELEHWTEAGYSLAEVDQVFERSDPAYNTVRTVTEPAAWHFEAKSQIDNKYLEAITPFLATVFELHPPPSGRFLLSMHDAVYPGHYGSAPGFAFSKKREDEKTLLFPDPFYLSTAGYEASLPLIDQSKATWEEKLPVAFWRGSSTGVSLTVDNWCQNHRVKLCLKAKEIGDDQLIDAKITNVVQCQDKSVEQLVNEAGITAPLVPTSIFLNYRYLIDIDGNSTAWGLYEKLYMGALILKVEGSFTQWFYPLLNPWEHYIPVASDLSNLVERIHWAHTHEAECLKIVERARELVLKLNYGVVVRHFGEVITTLLKAARVLSV